MTGHQGRSYLATVDTNEQYEIRVKGRLPQRWSAWFDGLTVTSPGDGTTVISGPVADQAALHGLIKRLSDVGMTLLSLSRISPTTTDPQEGT